LRRSAVLALVAIVAGCTGNDADTSALSTATTTEVGSTTTSVDTAGCQLGAGVDEAGEITFIDGRGRLIAAQADGGGQHCVAADVDPGFAWAGGGDKLLLPDGRIRSEAGVVDSGVPQEAMPAWSRPRGRSVIGVSPEGHLVKHVLDEPGGVRDISFLERHESAVYHPAGRAIASVGDGPDGYGIYLADNNGQLLRTLVTGESADISQLQWTVTGALMFVADHGDHTDLHRVDIESGALTTAATTPGSNTITDFVASTFAGGGVAWREGGCSARTPTTVALQGGEALPFPDEAAGLAPVGWLPDGTIVAGPSRTCASSSASPLFAVRAGVATKVADDAPSAAIRVILPTGPELPASIPDAAPA